MFSSSHTRSVTPMCETTLYRCIEFDTPPSCDESSSSLTKSTSTRRYHSRTLFPITDYSPRTSRGKRSLPKRSAHSRFFLSTLPDKDVGRKLASSQASETPVICGRQLIGPSGLSFAGPPAGQDLVQLGCNGVADANKLGRHQPIGLLTACAAPPLHHCPSTSASLTLSRPRKPTEMFHLD